MVLCLASCVVNSVTRPPYMLTLIHRISRPLPCRYINKAMPWGHASLTMYCSTIHHDRGIQQAVTR